MQINFLHRIEQLLIFNTEPTLKNYNIQEEYLLLYSQKLFFSVNV